MYTPKSETQGKIIFIPIAHQVEETKGDSGDSSMSTTTGSPIEMPLPKDLTDSIGIKYEMWDKGIMNTLSNMLADASASASSGNAGISSGRSYSGVANKMIGGFLNQAGLGILPNKHANFRGLEDSTWTFNWDFIFRSKGEFDELVSKIMSFKKMASDPKGSADSSVIEFIQSGAQDIKDALGAEAMQVGKPVGWNISIKGGAASKIMTFPEELVITNITSNFVGAGTIPFIRYTESPIRFYFSMTFIPGKTILPDNYMAALAKQEAIKQAASSGNANTSSNTNTPNNERNNTNNNEPIPETAQNFIGPPTSPLSNFTDESMP